MFNFCPDFAMRAFYFFRNALCSAARIFFSSSEPEASSSERYSSNGAQPASVLSYSDELVPSLSFLASEAALRESSSLRISAETWWFSELPRSTRDFSEATKERLWVMCSKVPALNSNSFLLPINLKLTFVSVLSFFTRRLKTIWVDRKKAHSLNVKIFDQNKTLSLQKTQQRQLLDPPRLLYQTW